MTFFLWLIGAFVVGIVYASFFEWTLHRFVMHKPLLNFDYAFKAHALVHHHIFRADKTYQTHDVRFAKKIPMAWWNGPVLCLIGTLPTIFISPYTSWAVSVGIFTALASYYATYERIHWCFHLPKARRIEKSWFFRRMNGHHLLHHRYMYKNFNVVLPLADFCLGTLLLRSKVKFAQATGPSLPDVQPQTERHRVWDMN